MTALARNTDPSTSHLAAAACEEFASKHRASILQALRLDGPAGKDELARRTGLDGVAIARRLPEMQRKGLVCPTGRTVPSSKGRAERVWRAA